MSATTTAHAKEWHKQQCIGLNSVGADYSAMGAVRVQKNPQCKHPDETLLNGEQDKDGQSSLQPTYTALAKSVWPSLHTLWNEKAALTAELNEQ